MTDPMPAPEIGPGAAPSTAASTSATTTTSPDDRGTAFRAAPNQETVKGGSLLLAAYAVVWVIVLFMIVRVFRRQVAVQRDVESLEKAIDKASKRAESAGEAKKKSPSPASSKERA